MSGMYSTKLVNSKFVDGNAYITVGDPYKDPKPNPFRQPKKGEKEPTAFRTTLIPLNAENGNFAKITYVGGSYVEGNRYIDTQPLDKRKKGFGSKDAHRRDEFTNSIRTQQYREGMKKEKELMVESAERVKLELTKLLAQRATTAPIISSGYSSQVPQYDIGRSRVTEFDPKSIKDHYYKFDSNQSKRFSDAYGKPISCDVGDLAWSIPYKPPSHGGKSEVKNFFDKSHLNVTL